MLQMYHHSNPVPNRTHKKSSTGCKACKLRKVKCDEAKPICKKCALHFSNLDKCDYEQPQKRTRKEKIGGSQRKVPFPHRVGSASSSPTTSSESPHNGFSTSESDLACGIDLALKSPNSSKTISDWAGDACCRCPCHKSSEYADMLSDSTFGICRICGNFPSFAKSIQQCCPVVPPAALKASSIDPFGLLPIKSSPSVQGLMHHWVNTLALRPTKIHSEYCTNPTWVTAAISNPALFNVTLYVSSLHTASLHSLRETSESLFYKSQTVKCLNECISDSKKAFADETIAAVLLLLFIVCVTGEEKEVEAHIRGLRQMINLRGGIHDFTIDGVFLHMLCTTNHLTAVLHESPSLHPPTGPPIALRPCFPYLCPPLTARCLMRSSIVWKYFGIKIGFHPIVADVLHELSYAYSVVDAFTMRLLPFYRDEFLEIERAFEGGPEYKGDMSLLVGNGGRIGDGDGVAKGVSLH